MCSSDLKVFVDYVKHEQEFGDVSILPTSTFFYGLLEHDELAVDLEAGKTLLINLQGMAENRADGETRFFYELNGQPRVVRIATPGDALENVRRKATGGERGHVGAPMPGMVASVAVTKGQRVDRGDLLLAIEAMKMEIELRAEFPALIQGVYVRSGSSIASNDLLIELLPV